MQRFENDRQDVAFQIADDRDIESVDREAGPQISAEHGERGDAALHLPARSHAAGEVHIVGNDQYGWLVHLKISFRAPPERSAGASTFSFLVESRRPRPNRRWTKFRTQENPG